MSGALLGGEYSYSQWRKDDGALLDVGPHVIDLLDVTLGSILDVTQVRRDDASDTWSLVFEHESGAVSTARMSLRTPVQPSLFRVELSGGDGVCALSDRSTDSTDCYRVLLDEFLQSVESGVPHACSVARGLHLQRIIEKVATTPRR